MSEWETVKLGDVAEIVSGGTPKTGVTEYWGGPHSWATPADLTNLNTVEIGNTERTLTDAGLSSSSARLLPTGSVLFSSRAPIGHIAITTKPMATNQGFKSFIPTPRLNARFLYWWLDANRGPLKALGTGATFKEVSKKVVSGVSISLPSEQEQRRIASILDEAGALRAARRTQLIHLDELPQSLLHEIPAGNLTSTPLGSIASFVRGVTYKPADVTDTGIGVMRTKNIQKDLDTSDVVRITPTRPIKSEKFLQNGDILVSSANSWNLVGKCCFVDNLPEPFAVGGFVTALRPTSDINPMYLYCWFNSKITQETVRSFGNQTTNIANLNIKRTEALPVPVPPKPVQESFAEKITAIRAERDRVAKALEADDELFAALQHRAFRGEL